MVNNIINNKFSNVAIIVDKKENHYICQSNCMIKKAKVATSCLVKPKVGDKVYVISDQSDIYILHILESNSNLSLETNKLDLVIKELNIDVNTLNLNIEYINSKISSLKSFITHLNIFSNIANFTTNTLNTISTKKHDLAKERINEYETLNNTINTLEKKKSNIIREEINIEHKNVNSSFTKAAQQIKFDAKNINLG